MLFVTPGYAQEAAPAADTTHGEVGAEAHEAKGAFPPFDPTHFPSQLLWLAISFGLFYLFLKSAVVPRIGGILGVRQDRIEQDLAQAGNMKAEADAAVAAYEQELAEAKAKANSIGQQARDQARADADAERKRVEAELDARIEQSEKGIAEIKTRAMGEVGTIAEDTATAILEALVGNADRNAVSAAVQSARG